MRTYREWTVGLGSGLRRATLDEIDDSGSQQILKKLRGLAGEKPEGVYRAQTFGLSSVPPAGSEGLIVALGGRSSRLIGLGFEHEKHRPVGSPAGTSVLYDAAGNVIFAKAANGIHVEAKDGKIVVKPPDGEFLFLGGDGEDGEYAFVETSGGPSINVKAKIG